MRSVRPRADAVAVYHLYVIEVAPEHRDPLRDWLDRHGIDTGIHYPIPLHLQAAYEHLDLAEGAFPVAEAKAKQIISLPIYPELTEAQQDHIVGTVRAYLERALPLRTRAGFRLHDRESRSMEPCR